MVTVAPEIVIFASVAAMVSNTELSDVFLITTFFAAVAVTVSLKVRTMSADSTTPTELSAGVAVDSVGAVESEIDVKFKVVASAIPA